MMPYFQPKLNHFEIAKCKEKVFNTVLKKDELMGHVKAAVPMTSRIKSKKQGRVMEAVEKLLRV